MLRSSHDIYHSNLNTLKTYPKVLKFEYLQGLFLYLFVT